MPLYALDKKKLLLQLQIASLFPENELQLEVLFPKIHRVADLVWKKKNLLFEIQCSDISPQEVRKRKKDYLEEGYFLIWLLDDRIFNQKRTSPSERLLRQQGAYFVHFSRKAPSKIYDQIEIVDPLQRLKKSPPSTVNLSHCYQTPKVIKAFPAQLQQRENILYYFEGDFLDRALKASNAFFSYLTYWKKSEERPAKKEPLLKAGLRIYHRLLDRLIEYAEG